MKKFVVLFSLALALEFNLSKKLSLNKKRLRSSATFDEFTWVDENTYIYMVDITLGTPMGTFPTPQATSFLIDTTSSYTYAFAHNLVDCLFYCPIVDKFYNPYYS